MRAHIIVGVRIRAGNEHGSCDTGKVGSNPARREGKLLYHQVAAWQLSGTVEVSCSPTAHLDSTSGPQVPWDCITLVSALGRPHTTAQ
jgi:hypothetical protein